MSESNIEKINELFETADTNDRNNIEESAIFPEEEDTFEDTYENIEVPESFPDIQNEEEASDFIVPEKGLVEDISFETVDPVFIKSGDAEVDSITQGEANRIYNEYNSMSKDDFDQSCNKRSDLEQEYLRITGDKFYSQPQYIQSKLDKIKSFLSQEDKDKFNTWSEGAFKCDENIKHMNFVIDQLTKKQDAENRKRKATRISPPNSVKPSGTSGDLRKQVQNELTSYFTEPVLRSFLKIPLADKKIEEYSQYKNLINEVVGKIIIISQQTKRDKQKILDTMIIEVKACAAAINTDLTFEQQIQVFKNFLEDAGYTSYQKYCNDYQDKYDEIKQHIDTLPNEKQSSLTGIAGKQKMGINDLVHLFAACTDYSKDKLDTILNEIINEEINVFQACRKMTLPDETNLPRTQQPLIKPEMVDIQNWIQWAESDELLTITPEAYQNISEKLDSQTDPKIITQFKQIDTDVPRTCELPKKMNPECLPKVSELLKMYVLISKDQIYTQGMNDLAGLIVNYIKDPTDALNVFAKLLRDPTFDICKKVIGEQGKYLHNLAKKARIKFYQMENSRLYTVDTMLTNIKQDTLCSMFARYSDENTIKSIIDTFISDGSLVPYLIYFGVVQYLSTPDLSDDNLELIDERKKTLNIDELFVNQSINKYSPFISQKDIDQFHTSTLSENTPVAYSGVKNVYIPQSCLNRSGFPKGQAERDMWVKIFSDLYGFDVKSMNDICKEYTDEQLIREIEKHMKDASQNVDDLSIIQVSDECMNYLTNGKNKNACKLDSTHLNTLKNSIEKVKTFQKSKKKFIEKIREGVNELKKKYFSPADRNALNKVEDKLNDIRTPDTQSPFDRSVAVEDTDLAQLNELKNASPPLQADFSNLVESVNDSEVGDGDYRTLGDVLSIDDDVDFEQGERNNTSKSAIELQKLELPPNRSNAKGVDGLTGELDKSGENITLTPDQDFIEKNVSQVLQDDPSVVNTSNTSNTSINNLQSARASRKEVEETSDSLDALLDQLPKNSTREETQIIKDTSRKWKIELPTRKEVRNFVDRIFERLKRKNPSITDSMKPKSIEEILRDVIATNNTRRVNNCLKEEILHQQIKTLQADKDSLISKGEWWKECSALKLREFGREKNLQSQLNTVTVENTKNLNQLEKARRTRDDIISKIRDLSSKKQKLSQERDELLKKVEENSQLQENLELNRKKLSEVEAELQKVTQEKNNLEAQLKIQDNIISEGKNTIQGLENNSQTNAKQIEELQLKLGESEKKQQNILKLHAIGGNLGEMSDDINKGTEEMSKLLNKIENIDVYEYEVLKEFELLSEEKNIDTLRTKVNQLKSEIEIYNQILESRKNRLQQIEIQINNSEQELNEFVSEISNLEDITQKKLVEDLKNELQTLKGVKEQHLAYVRGTIEKIKKYDERLILAKLAIEKMELELKEKASIENVLGQTQQQLEDSIENNKRLGAINKNLESELEKLKDALQGLSKDEINRMKLELNQLRTEDSRLKELNMKLEKELQENNEEVKEIHKQFLENSGNLQKNQAELSNLTESFNKKENKYQQEIKELDDELDKLDQQKLTLQNELTQLQNKSKKIKDQLLAHSNKQVEVFKNLKTELKQNNQKQDELTRQINILNVRNKKLKKQKLAIQQNLSNVQVANLLIQRDWGKINDLNTKLWKQIDQCNDNIKIQKDEFEEKSLSQEQDYLLMLAKMNEELQQSQQSQRSQQRISSELSPRSQKQIEESKRELDLIKSENERLKKTNELLNDINIRNYKPTECVPLWNLSRDELLRQFKKKFQKIAILKGSEDSLFSAVSKEELMTAVRNLIQMYESDEYKKIGTNIKADYQDITNQLDPKMKQLDAFKENRLSNIQRDNPQRDQESSTDYDKRIRELFHNDKQDNNTYHQLTKLDSEIEEIVSTPRYKEMMQKISDAKIEAFRKAIGENEELMKAFGKFSQEGGYLQYVSTLETIGKFAAQGIQAVGKAGEALLGVRVLAHAAFMSYELYTGSPPSGLESMFGGASVIFEEYYTTQVYKIMFDELTKVKLSPVVKPLIQYAVSSAPTERAKSVLAPLLEDSYYFSNNSDSNSNIIGTRNPINTEVTLESTQNSSQQRINEAAMESARAVRQMSETEQFQLGGEVEYEFSDDE